MTADFAPLAVAVPPVTVTVPPPRSLAMVDEVAFYARLHHLTPKYFASLIKAETGISSTEWITNYVIIQAKMLLDSHKEMTVQQISYHLGFSEQASFSRFFKANTGMSPTEYKEKG